MSEASLSKFLNLPVKNERMEKVGEVVDILAKKKDGRIIGILVKPNKINELQISYLKMKMDMLPFQFQL